MEHRELASLQRKIRVGNISFTRIAVACALIFSSMAVSISRTAQKADALVACNTAAQNSFTMAPSHGKVFYVDTGSTPVIDAGYVGYKFTNSTGATQTNLWVSLSNFVGGKLALANTEDQYFHLPDLAANATGTAYFMLRSTGGTNTAQTHDVKMYTGRPDLATSTLKYNCTYSFTKVQETIKAASNKVLDNTGDGVAIKASTTTATLGETLSITVEGATGTIGNGTAPDNSIYWLTPAAVSSWPTRSLRLENVSVTFDTNGNWSSTNDQVTYADQLVVSNAKSVVNTSDYRATFTYRVIGRPPATVKAVPVAQIASGSQVKHSDITAAGASVDLTFPNFSGNVQVTKSVTSSSGLSSVACSAGSCSSWGGVDGTTYLIVPYRLTATSSSATNSSIDELVDVPSASAKFFTDGTRTVRVTDVNNTNVVWASPSYIASEANLSPRPLHFVGPFTLSSARSATVDYWMAVPSVTGTYTNTAYALVGNTQVGASATAMSQVNVSTNGTTTITPVVTTQSFPTAVTTSPASSITTTGAVLNGSTDTNGASGLTAQFEYSLSADMSNATTVTATTPASGALITANDPSLTAVTLSGLTSYTTYYYRAKAGSTYGSILSFTTLGVVSTPTASTSAAGPTSLTTAQLNGVITPNLTNITGVQFLWGTSATLSTFTTVTVADPADATLPISLGGTSAQTVSFPLAAGTLTTGTTYYYKVRACPNGSASMTSFTCGTGFVDGAIVSFTTGTAPIVSTSSLPSSLKSAAYSATLAASGGSGSYSTWAISSGTLPSGLTLDPLTGIISGTTASNAASSTFSVTVTDSLGVVSVAKSLTITIIASKINQTITFSAISDQVFSLTPFNITPTSDSLLTVSVASQATSVCDVVAGATGGYDVYMLSVGTCTLRASQAGNSTYNAATNVDRSFAISKRSQTVTYSLADRIYGDITAFTTPASTSAAGEGLTPTYSGGTSGVCSINASTGQITILGAGTCSTQVDYPGNSNYFAGSATASFVIAKRNQVITFTQADKTYGDGTFTASASTDATGGGSMSYSSSTTGVCTVAGSTVTVVAAGSCTLTADHPGNGNWNSGSQSVTFNIAKKNQTVSFSQSGKTYGDANFTASATTDATGGGSMSYSSSTTGVCTVAGSTVTVVAAGNCTLTADHPGNGNWNSGSQSVTFAIAKKNQTVSFTQSDKTFGDADFNLLATTDASGSGTITFSSTTTSVCTVDSAGGVSIVSSGTCTVTASHPGNGNWNAGDSGAVSFAIAKKNQTIVLSPSSKSIADGSYDLTTVTTSDVTGGGTFTYSGGFAGVCSVASGGMVTFTGYGTCNVSVSHNGNGNWNNGTTNASFSITNKLTQSIVFNQSNTTYGASNFDASASTDASGGFTYTSQTPSVCTVTSSGRVTIVGAGDCTLSASNAGDNTYNSGQKAVTFAVAKKNQVVSLSQGGKTFGDSDFGVTASTDATGDGTITYTSSTTSVCSVSLSGTVSIVGAGNCTLTADHPGNGNWNSGSRSVTFAVAKKNQTVSFTQSGKTYGDANFTASASTDATGGGSISYSSSTTGVCTVSGATVTVVAAGDCTLTADHPGNGNWNSGSRSVTFAVAKKNQTVTFSQSGKTYGDANFTASASTDATGGGSMSYSSSTTGVCTVSGATVSVVAAGNCTLTADHPGNGNWNSGSRSVTFAVAKKNQTISFAQSDKVFGDANFTASASTDATGGGSMSYSSSTTGVCTVSGATITIVDVGDCTLTSAHPGNGNWNNGSASTTFRVGKGQPALSFSQSSKVVGDPNFTVAASTPAQGGTFTYTSTTSSVCTVTAQGVVTIVGVGTCTITADFSGTTQWNQDSVATSFSVTAVATTTTTLAPTTTTSTTFAPSATPVSGNDLGSVTGQLWLDIDHNGKKEKNEPPMASVDVRLTSSGVSTASVATAAVHVQAYSVVTDANGYYLFTSVPVGTYKIDATLPKSAGLVLGASTTVTVQAQKKVLVDVPAVGQSSVTGITVDSSLNKPVPGAKVTCTWVAFDITLTTSDDVDIPTTSDAMGRFVIKGIPAGDYSCNWKNSLTGEVVDSAKVTLAPVSLVGTKAKIVRLRATSAQVARMSPLAATGSPAQDQVRLALMLMVVGFLLVRRNRRRV